MAGFRTKSQSEIVIIGLGSGVESRRRRLGFGTRVMLNWSSSIRFLFLDIIVGFLIFFLLILLISGGGDGILPRKRFFTRMVNNRYAVDL